MKSQLGLRDILQAHCNPNLREKSSELKFSVFSWEQLAELLRRDQIQVPNSDLDEF